MRQNRLLLQRLEGDPPLRTDTARTEISYILLILSIMLFAGHLFQ
jgi:hypothetical protein